MVGLSEDDIRYFKRCTSCERYDDLYWGFSCFSRQNFKKPALIKTEDDVIYGVYSNEGGTLAEMTMQWQWIQGEVVPCLEVFSDAFFLLESPMHKRIMKRLLKFQKQYHELFTPDEFSRLLIGLGFQDNSANPLKA